MYAYDFAIKNELDKIQYDSSGKICNMDSRVKVDLTPLRPGLLKILRFLLFLY